MDLEFLLNPWVISAIVVVFVIGNLASMKYLGQSHLVKKDPNKTSDIDRLIEIYKQKDAEEVQNQQSTTSKIPSKKSHTDKD